MPKGRARAKRQKNRERQDRAYRSRVLPPGVPQDSLYVNVTELTNKFVRQGCSLTISPMVRLVYLVCGVGLGVSGVIGRVFFGIDNLVLILVLLLGFTLVWQSMHLGMEPARRMMKQFAKAGDETRHHVYFATKEDFGVVLYNGTVRRFGWDTIDNFSGTKSTFTLTLKGNPIVFIMDTSGFVRGTPAGFMEFAFDRIDPLPRSAVYKTAYKMFTALDNWSAIRAQARAADAEKKAARKARRVAKREARKEGESA